MAPVFHLLGIALLAFTQVVMAQDNQASAIQTREASPELADGWWQWAMSSPRQSSPVSDRTGERCAMRQSGDVWFLAGGFGSSKIKRRCTVPAGKSLFFPLINMVYGPGPETDGTLTCERAKERAALNNDTAIDLFAEVDGIQLTGLKQRRLASRSCFDVFSRMPVPQKPYEAYPSASDGYWLFLEPLAPGQHTLKFGGRYQRGGMLQDIQYELIVE